MSVMFRVSLIALLMSCVSVPVNAYDVLISVTGQLRGNTCIVSADSKELNVPLGNVGTRQFRAAGASSNIKTAFMLNLEDCGPTFSGVRVTFQGTPDVNNPQLIKINDGGATGVAVELLDSSSKRIALNSQSDLYGNAGVDSVQMKFYAQLTATGTPVNPGAVSAVATWVTEYQ